jgi:L-alanine-DL-glutamate epimerase-like enolase superfamily enzyme
MSLTEENMQSRWSRRKLFRAAGALGVNGAAGLIGISNTARPARAAAGAPLAVPAPAVNTPLNLSVKKVERTWFNVPFRPVPARNMIRELPHWTVFELCKVTLACGVSGFGETMQYYTWGTVSESAIQRVMDRNAAEHMWDDSLGCGLQMALFDAVAKANGVPLYRLLGRKIRDRAFVSWWAIDMPAEDWVLECKDAAARGYTAFKTKARPWWDLYDQCAILMKTLPPYFRVNFDFNATLNDSAHAGRYTVGLENKYPQIWIWESPIPQSDVAGNKQLRSQTRVAIAMHYGSPPPMTALREDVCDGFVIGGGASRVMDNAIVAATFGKPFFLELVGTGITATYSLHFASVLSHAQWPQVDCHMIYTHHMIRPSIKIENGMAAVPEAPGLGVELDEDALARFRIEPLKEKPPSPPDLLIAIRFPSGAVSYYVNAEQYWADYHAARLPIFPKGVYLERIPDNGSREWKDLRARAARAPVHSGARIL